MDNYLQEPNSGGGEDHEDCFFREGCYHIGREDSEEEDSSSKHKTKKGILLDELKILNKQLLCEQAKAKAKANQMDLVLEESPSLNKRGKSKPKTTN